MQLRNFGLAVALSVGLTASSAARAVGVTFEGTAVGSWNDPDATYGYAINNTDAGGIAAVKWGWNLCNCDRNKFTFDGVGSDADPMWSTTVGLVYPSQPFVIGSFSYHNAPTLGILDNFSGIDLAVKVQIVNPLNPDVTDTFELGFSVVETVNIGTFTADVAYVSNPDHESTSFAYMGTNYTLTLLGFSGNTWTGAIGAFTVPENGTAYAQLYAVIEPSGNAAVVPLPASAPLFISALTGMGMLMVSRRRRWERLATA